MVHTVGLLISVEFERFQRLPQGVTEESEQGRLRLGGVRGRSGARPAETMGAKRAAASVALLPWTRRHAASFLLSICTDLDIPIVDRSHFTVSRTSRTITLTSFVRGTQIYRVHILIFLSTRITPLPSLCGLLYSTVLVYWYTGILYILYCTCTVQVQFTVLVYRYSSSVANELLLYY